MLAAGASQVVRARAARPRAARARTAAAPKPRIVWSPIPFGADRVRQMRAYARRHYGLDRARLLEPKAIVEHFTASSTYGPAFNTFAANSPDVEFGERPGVCAHFIVDRDGTIHQLVRLKWMCRHTVGLNHVAFGIEHVGTSDADVMGRRRQLIASLRAHPLAARRATGFATATSSGTARASPARTTASAWRRCATARTATSRRRRCAATGGC